MCGAFAYFTAKGDSIRLAEILSAYYGADAAEFQPRYNIRPTQSLLAIDNSKERSAHVFRFGFTPVFNDKALWFNTRDDKLLSGKGYWKAFKDKRCIILANGFYEWQGEKAPKQPHFIQLPNAPTFAFAGLWNSFEKDGQTIRHASIITTAPNDLMAPIHNRMPVILDPDRYEDWLSPQSMELVEIGSFLQSYPAEKMSHHPVSRDVGPVVNDHPNLIKALP
jgi:putative SOS response-associated peptidase YedK